MRGSSGLTVEGGTTPVTSPHLLHYLIGLCAACVPAMMATKSSKASVGVGKVPVRRRTRSDSLRNSNCSVGSEFSESLAEMNCQQQETRHKSMPPIDFIRQFLSRDRKKCATLPSRSAHRKQRMTSRYSESDVIEAKAGSYFPFQDLPVDCRLKIFSFLTPKERGSAAQVCSEWRELMKCPSLWTIVDLTQLPLCTCSDAHHICGAECYTMYKRRIKKFMQYLQSVRPALRRFSFALDIADYRDSWQNCLEQFLNSAHCQDLEFAHLNWKETPIKPLWLEEFSCSVNDYNNLVHRHRYRQRRFVNFFDTFTKVAPNVSKLILPFDWSERSTANLKRLHKLNTLVLEKYFVFKYVSQESLDLLLESVPSLEKLILEVWTPSGVGFCLYQMQCEQLKYLDISQCRGFYLDSLKAPKLEVFKVTRHPWNGPLTSPDSVNIPCIYEVLCTGTPSLRQINEHTLHANWTEESYPELETVMSSICSCRKHKKGWVM